MLASPGCWWEAEAAAVVVGACWDRLAPVHRLAERIEVAADVVGQARSVVVAVGNGVVAIELVHLDSSHHQLPTLAISQR